MDYAPRTFQSLAHLNDCTRRWLAEVADVRVHRQTDRRPIDLHAEEQPHLIPLPANPYDVAEVVYRSVDGRRTDRLRTGPGRTRPASSAAQQRDAPAPADGRTSPPGKSPPAG
jgi:hypothetical protein